MGVCKPMMLHRHPECPPVINRDLLVRNVALATFEGLQERQSMAMIFSQIFPPPPPKTFMTFKILDYIEYEKHGKYGEEKKVVMGFETSRQSDVIQAMTEALQQGDLVKLGWNHDYVTRSGDGGVTSSESTERPIFLLERAPKIVLTVNKVHGNSEVCLVNIAGEAIAIIEVADSSTVGSVRAAASEKIGAHPLLVQLLLHGDLLEDDEVKWGAIDW